MDIVEAVKARKSIRAFKPDPVPRSVLGEILETAIRAPSWGNTQPWDFFVATGEKLEAIRQGFAEKAGEQSVSVMDIARPQEFPEPYASRRRLPARPAEAAPSPTASPEVRRPPRARMFGAPCVIYIGTGRDFYFQSKGINAWPIFDCGLVAENIMLLATGFGLGTIALAQAVTYPDVVRRVLEVPDSKLIVVGIAVGYPDWDDPVTQRNSVRESLASVAQWCGFE